LRPTQQKLRKNAAMDQMRIVMVAFRTPATPAVHVC
jgi:hypothetical protein